MFNRASQKRRQGLGPPAVRKSLIRKSISDRSRALYSQSLRRPKGWTPLSRSRHEPDSSSDSDKDVPPSPQPTPWHRRYSVGSSIVEDEGHDGDTGHGVPAEPSSDAAVPPSPVTSQDSNFSLPPVPSPTSSPHIPQLPPSSPPSDISYDNNPVPEPPSVPSSSSPPTPDITASEPEDFQQDLQLSSSPHLSFSEPFHPPSPESDYPPDLSLVFDGSMDMSQLKALDHLQSSPHNAPSSPTSLPPMNEVGNITYDFSFMSIDQTGEELSLMD